MQNPSDQIARELNDGPQQPEALQTLEKATIQDDDLTSEVTEAQSA